MLRDDIILVKECVNIIHITYYGTDEEKSKCSDILDLELTNNKHIEIDYLIKDDDGLNSEVAFDSEWVAPLQFLQHLCNKHNVDIIGIAHEFKGGYVESFELKNQLIEEEEIIDHTIIITPEFALEEINELPKDQDVEFLDEENSDGLNLTDAEILKSFQ